MRESVRRGAQDLHKTAALREAEDLLERRSREPAQLGSSAWTSVLSRSTNERGVF
jgi:hypothetical protein